jgi:hypothetical protein
MANNATLFPAETENLIYSEKELEQSAESSMYLAMAGTFPGLRDAVPSGLLRLQ